MHISQIYKNTYIGVYMLVNITNQSLHTVYIDKDGNSSTDDTVVVGPKGRVKVDIPSEKRFLEIAKQFKKQIIIRKV